MSTTPLLDIRDLRIRYGNLRAVDGASLSITAGETLGLVGESGCGKTSLAKAIAGLLPIDGGSITIDNVAQAQLQRQSRTALPRTVQLLHQDASAALSPRLKIETLLAEPLQITGRWSRSTREELLGSLRTLGLNADLLKRYPHQLSGGQAKRVALLRALTMEPRLLIGDEPTAGLDLSVQGDILNLLVRLQRERQLTYLLVSHNLNVIGRVTNRVAVMYLGQIVESGPTRHVFQRPAHPYTAALLSANPVLQKEKRKERIVLKGDLPSPIDPPAGCRFHTRCPYAQAKCRIEAPIPAAAGDSHTVSCHFPLAG
jgi:oligopeptide transport system ATP-binding protein